MTPFQQPGATSRAAQLRHHIHMPTGMLLHYAALQLPYDTLHASVRHAARRAHSTCPTLHVLILRCWTAGGAQWRSAMGEWLRLVRCVTDDGT